jgi:DNA-binding response OmpR family regulator
MTTSLKKTLSKYNEVFKIEKPILLLTEDHKEMRAFIAGIVRPFFTVIEAANGLEALEILGRQKVDMIISDVMMPKMDGFELLEKIKGDKKLKNISMIMLTARAAEEDKLFALTLGVDDYLTKPFSREELLVRSRNILENRINRKISEKEDQAEDETPSDVDSIFVNSLKEIIDKYINDSRLTVTFIALELNMSESKLLRKSKLLTGLSPTEFIKEVRLQKSKILLEKNQVETVAEAAYTVGFDNAKYFSIQFVNRFGKRPSEVHS